MKTTSDEYLHALWKEVDLPERAYELALHRYEDLGEWLARPQSSLVDYDTHVFVQGSFAFGTPIRPVIDGEEFDLDFSCKLRSRISRQTHSQIQLKMLVGEELAAYRNARGIQKPLTEKNRCWRLGYKDELPFHMDVVPGIRADEARRRALIEAMQVTGIDAPLAQEVARRALWITDIQDKDYAKISDDWPSSNPGGYQLWFLSRMHGGIKKYLAEAQVDPAPVYRSKTPLQQVVQLLKRHRDVMFQHDSDRKPVSIILTTVAGGAYVAGESLSQTMRRVLQALDAVRRSDTNFILNPVNPAENFADRWARADCVHLQLKANFHRWIGEAIRDFEKILDGTDPRQLVECAEDAFKLILPEAVRRRFGIVAGAPALVRSVQLQGEPARPWADW
mgnify:CR=1 FL=1